MQALTTGDIAKLCGVHFRTVIRWIQKGKLKAYQLPGRGDNRVEVDDLLAFLVSHNMPIPDVLLQESKRVLIIESDVSDICKVEDWLGQADFETKSTGCSFEAGVLLVAWKPSVLIINIDMPGINWLEIIELIKSSSDFKMLHIIILSEVSEDSLKTALDAGANVYLIKPLNQYELISTVKKMHQLSTLKRNLPVKTL